MKAEDKPKYLKESRNLLESLDMEVLIADPNNLKEIKKINRLAAIFRNFSYNDGQELNRLFQVFQKWARSSSRKGTIKNRAVDVVQFIDQKIQDMDIYVIEEPIKKSQDRIIQNLKNEKFWIRSSLEGKDLHVIVGERDAKQGEHVHIISDSENGAIRYDTHDQHPSELLERVVSVVTKSGPTIGVTQKGVKTTMEFFENGEQTAQDMPILYATGIRHSGGSNGHFEYITIKNIGKSIALDIHWGIRAFAYEWRPSDEPFELEPNKEKEVTFPVSGEKIFTDVIPELNVIMEYKDANNKSYFTRRELIQEKVPSGAFYKLKAGVFHPPSLLVDDGLRMISEPVKNGDRIEATFEINTKEGVKQAKIGLSGTLIAILGLDTDDLIKQAILELAHRKIRNMIKSDTLVDYCFTTSDLPEGHPGGFEAYTLLRGAIA